MCIIDKSIKNITKYIQLGKENLAPIQYGCRNCGFEGRLHRHGVYYRNVITKLRITRIPIQRVKCPSCNKTYSVLPSFLVPYFQYSLQTILLCLFMGSLLDFSYGKILMSFHKVNPLSTLTPSHLRFWRKRFKGSLLNLHLFFAAYNDFYWDMESPTPFIVLKKIKDFGKKDSLHACFFETMGFSFLTSFPNN